MRDDKIIWKSLAVLFGIIFVWMLVTGGFKAQDHDKFRGEGKISRSDNFPLGGVVKVQGQWLTKDVNVSVKVPIDEETGYAVAQVEIAPAYRAEMERPNGTYEKVDGGKAAIHTEGVTTRIVLVYDRAVKDGDPISKHRITIEATHPE